MTEVLNSDAYRSDAGNHVFVAKSIYLWVIISMPMCFFFYFPILLYGPLGSFPLFFSLKQYTFPITAFMLFVLIAFFSAKGF
ncbi:unnamed protein product [Boreogadus saida]